MRKKILMLQAACLAAVTVSAGSVRHDADSVYKQDTFSKERMLMPVKPTYLRNVSEAADWGRNWFVEIKGGASAFLGSPLGCGDVFDRLTPSLQVGVGKWLTPAIGGRVGFQGLTFKNAEFKTMGYQFYHADLMYNLTPYLSQNEYGLSLLDVVPYVGVGLIHNANWTDPCICGGGADGSRPFAFTYGVELGYRISNRVKLTAGVSGLTTARNFDGMGSSIRFKDNMLTVSAGLSFTLGKAGWKRVVDAAPYIAQNARLKEYISCMHDGKLRTQEKMPEAGNGNAGYPRNNYSGLNSLRARLSMRDSVGMADTGSQTGGSPADDADRNPQDTLSQAGNQEIGVGVPVYFFFRLNSDRLVDESQIVNLDDIAEIARRNNLKVNIYGAADSATGTQASNQELALSRAGCIAGMLMDRGVPEDSIQMHNFGGIDKYEAIDSNRFTMVILTE